MKTGYLIAVMIIIAVTVDKIEDKITDNEFKQQTEIFISKGARNTAIQGKQLCNRLNRLESLHNIKQTDCDKHYD